jgi:hypothetical protein
MQTNAGTGTHRLAWLVRSVPPFVLAVLLVLATLLFAEGRAHATTHAPPSTISVALEEEPEEDGEFEEEACEAAEEELEEGDLGEAEVEAICNEANDEGGGRAAGTISAAREECLLRSAHARAVALTKRKRLKLTVGYTTFEPTRATIEIGGGSTQIGSFHRHLGRSGVLRIVKRLGRGPAPRRIVVRFRIAGAPGHCTRHQTARITVSRTR